MSGNKRRVTSGVSSKRVKSEFSVGAVLDSKFDSAGFLALQMPKRRFVDLSNVPVPRPTGPRADKKRQNKKVETSRWVGSSYVTLDNQVMGSLSSNALTMAVNQDYQFPDIVIAPDDTSKVGSNMWSAPIGLRVMQQHFGSRAGTMVGPRASYDGYTPVYATGGNSLVNGTVASSAWTSGVLLPATNQYSMSTFTTANDPLRQQGALNTGSMFFNQIGIQWCPIVPNFLDKNDFEKLSNYKYLRFLKFGMRITIDGDSFHRSKKNNVMTSYQYAQPAAQFFGGAATGHLENGYPAGVWGGEQAAYGDASVDFNHIPSGDGGVSTTHYNITRAGPKASCVQPYGSYEYMIVGPERLQQINLPALMGYSSTVDAVTDGLGCVHVWDTLREHGIPVHKCKKNVIDLSWKPYAVNVVSTGIGTLLDTETAGPLSPVVEIDVLTRQSAPNVTPKLFCDGYDATMNSLSSMSYSNGYPYAHIGPVVLIRFACDPGVSTQAHKVNNNTDTTIQAFTVVNPMAATIPFHVKCWSTYEAYGEDFDTFDVNTSNMWKLPVLPTVYPYEQANPNTLDPTNAA